MEYATAIILAGGLGTRLQHIHPNKQKVIVEINTKPFLSYLLDQLSKYLEKVVLCVGHYSEQVHDIFGDHYGNLTLRYSEEKHLLGTAGALRLALTSVDSEDIIVLNGDSFCDVKLDHFFKWHTEKNAQASMLLATVNDTRRFGRVTIDHEHRIIAFEEKGATLGPGMINAGIYILRGNVIKSIRKGRRLSLEHDVFPELINSGFYGYCGEYSRFIDIGTPTSLKEAEQIFSTDMEQIN